MATTKGLLKSLARKFGLDVSRFGHTQRLGSDSSYTIEYLLRKQPVKTIFDVGANIGQTAEEYRQRFPAATIHSFEPAQSTFEQLESTFRADSRVKVWKLAISDIDGQKTFYINKDHTTNSLLASSDHLKEGRLLENMEQTGSSTVDCLTLDTFCKQQSINEINLLKMDIQGAELQAIKGGKDLFQRKKVDVVFCEVMFSPLYRDACDFTEIRQAMTGFGYMLYGIYNLFHFERDGLLWGDAIFVNPILLTK